MLTLPKQNEFENVPADSYGAVCYRVVDLGTQFSAFYKKTQHKIMISWELDAKMKDGRPFTIHKRYTLSSGRNAILRKDLESWRGKPFSDEDYGTFDLGKLIGVPCMIGISHRTDDGQTYADVSSIMKLPKSMIAPKPENEPLYFSITDFNMEIYNKLSDGTKAIIAKSPEFQQRMGAPENEQSTQDAHDTPENSEVVPF